jgi:hypothetical protein
MLAAPVTDTQDILSLRLARYGVPAVILVFYLTAALAFRYTPDSTFIALGGMSGIAPVPPGMSVSPLWAMLLAGAASAGLDPLLAAKVLSLLFSSIALLTTFLIAVEILRDRFLAFAVVLAVAAEACVLQVAISGHPFALGMALVLGSVFFLQRNEYPVSSVLAGLAALVFWQALLLVPILAADAVANFTEPEKRAGRALQVTAAAAAVAALWPAIALATGRGMVSWMPPLRELTPPTVSGFLIYGLEAAACLAGGFLLLRRGKHGRRIILALLPAVAVLLVFAAASVAGGREIWRMALPLLFAGALFGVRIVFSELNRVYAVYPVAFLLAGLTLIANQMEVQARLGDTMAGTASRNDELAAISVWVRSHAPAAAPLYADVPAVVAYYAGRPVLPSSDHTAGDGGMVVSPRMPAPGYVALYRLPASIAAQDVPGSYAVWRKP